MPNLEGSGGASLHYEDEGSGPLLILLHGGTGTGAYDWEFQRPRLREKYRVVVPDLRGHGRSSDPEWQLDINTIGEDLLLLIDRIGQRPAAIIGFSIGATAGLALLCRQPDLTAAFVAIGASVRGRPESVDDITAGPWPKELMALSHEHGGEDHWRKLRRRLGESWATHLNITEADLRQIAIPFLAVCGDRDRIEPPETALHIARTVPRGELLILPRAGHFVTRDRPAEFGVALDGFLSRSLSPGR